VFKCRSILMQFSLCITALLVLLMVSASIGMVGLNQLFTTASHAMEQDVRLAQRAANIGILVLNERRYEKDAFINLADAASFSAWGAGGHFIAIIPALQLVVVHRVDTDDPEKKVTLKQFGKLLRLILVARKSSMP
jgi:CubicO group peptidase (beta-lactamase class C family)